MEQRSDQAKARRNVLFLESKLCDVTNQNESKLANTDFKI